MICLAKVFGVTEHVGGVDGVADVDWVAELVLDGAVLDGVVEVCVGHFVGLVG